MIIYTSGTTGKPKGAQHVHAGFPVKGAQDMAHCFDVQPGDILFWYHRHRLDDGALGDQRRADAGRDPLHVRRHARLPATLTVCGP